MWRLAFRRLWENLGTLLLAFALSFAVWISAVVAADPNEARDFPGALVLEVRGQDPSLILLGSLPTQVTLRLSAPVSLWDRLATEAGAVTAFIDLTGLESGEYTIPVQVETSLGPIRVIQVVPEEVSLVLEPRAVREFPVIPLIEGQPALGFQVDDLVVNPVSVTVSGPQSLVLQVHEVLATLSVEGVNEPISREIELQAVDSDGNVLSGLTIEPAFVSMEQSIRQAGGYRTVAVRVETIGQPANGFRVTNISVTPTVVVLFSTDPQIVQALPGFVSTLPLDLTNLEEDVEARLALNLPQGVIVVGEEQNVEVAIGIAPIESSVLVNLQVEIVGLASGYEVELSPESVSVILSGPLSVLQSLGPDDVRLLIDVSGLSEGTHLLEPIPEILPEDVFLLSITPSAIEIVITRSSP